MAEPKRKPGRPNQGGLSPLQVKQRIIAEGGRIMQLRLTPEANDAAKSLVESGEFSTTTKAINAAIVEAAQRRT